MIAADAMLLYRQRRFAHEGDSMFEESMFVCIPKELESKRRLPSMTRPAYIADSVS